MKNTRDLISSALYSIYLLYIFQSFTIGKYIIGLIIKAAGIIAITSAGLQLVHIKLVGGEKNKLVILLFSCPGSSIPDLRQ